MHSIYLFISYITVDIWQEDYEEEEYEEEEEDEVEGDDDYEYEEDLMLWILFQE